MSKFKKTASLVLALTLVVSGLSIPTTAFASTNDNISLSSTQTDIVTYTSGNFIYEINNDNSATITGFSLLGSSASLNQIPSTIDGHSVTGIGPYAFEGKLFYGNSYYFLPETLTSVGEGAFNNCTLKPTRDDVVGCTINIPASLNEVGNKAFNFSSLFEAKISDKATVIPDYLFNDCAKLCYVFIPNSVVSIGKYAFSNCASIKNFSLPIHVEKLGECAFKGVQDNSTLVIPRTLTTIDKNCFENSYIYSVTFEEGTTKIISNIFKNCGFLKTVNIPSSVVEIEDSAFENCIYLDSISFDKLINSNVKKIGNNVFKGCLSINAYVTIPKHIVSWGKNCFADTRVMSATIEDGTEKILANTFSNCETLSTVKIPSSVTCIEDDAFKNCYSLSEIVLPSSLEELGNNVFENCINIRNINIPKILKKSGTYCFHNDNFFSYSYPTISVKIEDGMEKIPDNLFYACNSLTDITMPNSVTEIGSCAFINCFSLKNIVFSNNLKVIGNNAFSNSLNLNTLSIPKTINAVGPNAFFNAGVSNVIFEDGTEKIPDNMFYGCTNLISVSCPESVTVIGDNAFAFCLSLKKFNFSPNLKVIGMSAFEGCYYLQLPDDFILPKTLESIKAKAFSGVYGQKNIVIPSSVQEIGLNSLCYANGSFPKENCAIICDINSAGAIYAKENKINCLFIGDVNKDGHIDVSDVTNIQKYLAKIIDFDDIQKLCTDIDKDGYVNVSDVTTIQEYLANLI